MFNAYIEIMGDLVIVECEGRIVRSEAAFQLRDAVTSQQSARLIVLDLSEVSAIEGGGLGMLVFLQHWAHDQDVRLKLFNPSHLVRERLERASTLRPFEMATLDELIALLRWGDGRETLAA